MNNLILIIKASTAMYHAWRLYDIEVMKEISNLVDEIPKTKASIVAEDKKVERLLRDLVEWIKEQPKDSEVITSLLKTKVAEILLNSPELERSFEGAFDSTFSVDGDREIIFKIIKELRDTDKKNKFNLKLKSILRPFLFEGENDLSKDEWIKLGELLDDKLSTYSGDVDKAVLEEANMDSPENMISTIEQLKVELSPEGIMVSPFQMLNSALGPDFGFRRALAYLIEALTNRGKSLFLAHILAGFVLYNIPKLIDKSKRPTIFFCSAEDSMGLVLRRMFEIFVTVETGSRPDFFEFTAQDVVNKLVEVFTKRGWNFVYYRVDPTHDDINEYKQRTRNLEMKGCEIIVAAYDYLAMMNLKGTHGETRSDKLQDLVRQWRNFLIARRSIALTPWQLNPKAKEELRENDDESEVYFIRDNSGHSMTEGTTKVTNEVDVVIGVHMAKLISGASWFTAVVSKMRGEGVPFNERFFIQPVEQGSKEKPGKGLLHDIGLEKALGKRSLSAFANTSNSENEFDNL